VNKRRFGRTGWQVSEIGYGMWGMAGWTGSDDRESLRALERAIELGCNFFDTAWAYGAGHSEKLLAEILGRHRDSELYVATKIPPKNMAWPARPEYALDDVFPTDHIREYIDKSLANLGTSAIDLIQFHVWSDRWAQDERWRRTIEELKRGGKIRAVGISVNRWEPENGIAALQTGAIDAVQVIYNIFDQAPEDVLFPLCAKLDIAVIARVPFDEGSLTGTLRADSTWPEGDWRNIYFNPDNLRATLARIATLERDKPAGMTLPQLALRFILADPRVSTVIPGMRRVANVESNLGASAAGALPAALVRKLRAHRWDRKPSRTSS
jgi:aryl-alcohol dehydrogenase-like predicted oxidoreductase